MHLVPLKYQTILDILNGGVVAWLVDTDTIEQFEPGKALTCLFLDTLTTPGVEPVRRSSYAAYMISKFIHVVTEMGSRGVEISKVYGASRTPSGIRLLKNAGFQVIKQFDSGAITFGLDIMNSNERVLRGYKEALRQWKEDQKV